MSIKVLITGDYCPIGRNQNKIEQEDYSFMSAFASYAANADLAITNLEAPITEGTKAILKAGPNIKLNKNSLKPLNKFNFNLVTLANNHILDYGEDGVVSTIKRCIDSNINYVGAGENINDARKLFKTIIDSKIVGVINFAENEFCAATENSFGANPVNIIANHNDIVKAKKEVDFLFVIAHGGREHYQLPSPKTRERYRFYASSGADVVVAHHPHCYSGYEIYGGTPIFYSLGNFIFDYKKKYQSGMWTEGYGVVFNIVDGSIDFKLIPFFQGRDQNPDLVLMEGEDLVRFNKKIKELNEIIVVDQRLMNCWSDYLETQKTLYKGSLFIQNKYLRGLMIKEFLPPVFIQNKVYKSLVLNLFRCETHKEIISNILESEL